MDVDDILKIIGAVAVTLLPALTLAVVTVINALNKQTQEIKTGNERAAVADEEKLSLARQGAQMDARKVELSEAIANPFQDPAQPARTTADPLESRIQRIEEAIAVIRAALPPR